ncbi:MAG: tetratricopeptide repeat protein [Desulfomonilaceae bacterium]
MRVKIFQRILIVLIILFFLPGSGYSSSGQDFFREAYVASMKREWNLAIDLYNKSINLNPDNAAAYVQRASVYQMVERFDDAIRDYEEALKLRPDYYLAMEYLGSLYENRNEYSKAVQIYSRALSLVKDPKWRSVIQWKISEAKKKAVNARADRGRILNR